MIVYIFPFIYLIKTLLSLQGYLVDTTGVPSILDISVHCVVLTLGVEVLDPERRIWGRRNLLHNTQVYEP